MMPTQTALGIMKHMNVHRPSVEIIYHRLPPLQPVLVYFHLRLTTLGCG